MFLLRILTPQGVAFEKSVDEVRIPGVQGEFGILPGHIPLISATQKGTVQFRAGTELGKIQVEDGFAQIAASGEVVVLVKKASLLG